MLVNGFTHFNKNRGSMWTQYYLVIPRDGLQNQEKSINLGSKIHQVGLQNQEKSINLGSKIHQVGFQNQEKSVLEGVLGPSWPQEAPKRHPRGPKSPSKRLPRKLRKMVLVVSGAILGPKIDKKQLEKYFFGLL